MPTIVPYYQLEDGKYTSPTNLPTPDEIRQEWCFGLPLSDETGQAMSDAAIVRYLESAIKEVERRLGVFLKPTVVVCNAEERGLTEGVDYEIDIPPHDYDSRNWFNYGFLQLHHKRVIELTEFKLILPNGQLIYDFLTNPQWVKLNKRNGQVQIVPYAGDPTILTLAGATLTGYPLLTGAIQGEIPQMLWVSYVAGFPLGQVPADIRNVVAKVASVDVLGVAGDALLAGVASQSTSIDGLSESISTTASATNATYGAHILQYQREIDSFFDPKAGNAATYYGGIAMV